MTSAAEQLPLAYDALKAINWSSLKNLHVSPLLYRRRLEVREESTPDQIIGLAIHCMSLESDKFDSRFGEYDGTRKGEPWRAWQAEHPGVQSLKPHEMERVRRASDALF